MALWWDNLHTASEGRELSERLCFEIEINSIILVSRLSSWLLGECGENRSRGKNKTAQHLFLLFVNEFLLGPDEWRVHNPLLGQMMFSSFL